MTYSIYFILIISSLQLLSSCNTIKTEKVDPKLVKELRLVWQDGEHNVLHIYDAVPNKETAVKIAKAVLIPFYSEEEINDGSYNCDLVDDSVWYVSLTYEDIITELEVIVYVSIQKKDGKVLLIMEADD